MVNCYMCQKVASYNRETKALRKRPCHPEPDNKRCVRVNHIKNAGSTIAVNRPVNSWMCLCIISVALCEWEGCSHVSFWSASNKLLQEPDTMLRFARGSLQSHWWEQSYRKLHWLVPKCCSYHWNVYSSVLEMAMSLHTPLSASSRSKESEYLHQRINLLKTYLWLCLCIQLCNVIEHIWFPQLVIWVSTSKHGLAYVVTVVHARKLCVRYNSVNCCDVCIWLW